jgi:hypothetical protein
MSFKHVNRMRQALARHVGSRSAGQRPRDAAGIRQELVARVRAEIASGRYLTEEKWEAALERLITSISA